MSIKSLLTGTLLRDQGGAGLSPQRGAAGEIPTTPERSFNIHVPHTNASPSELSCCANTQTAHCGGNISHRDRGQL